MNHWIKCADRLPKMDQVVFLYQKHRGIWIGSRSEDGSEVWLWAKSYSTPVHDGQKWDGECEMDDDYNPTHWMEFPGVLPPDGLEG